MLVTVDRYRAITGDDSTAASAVSARIEEATEALEDILDRPLTVAERTENLRPTRDGRLWPKAVPISDAGDYTVDGHALRSAAPFNAWVSIVGADDGTVAVTYTGGFVERTANPDATNRLPSYMERDIAWAARKLGQTAAVSSIPAGATSASVGDVTVVYGKGGAPATPDPLSGVWNRLTLAWRHAPIGGAP